MNAKYFLVIIITGSAGFIGKQLACYLLKKKFSNLVLVDFLKPDSVELKDCQFVHTDDIFSFLDNNNKEVSFIFHLGAFTDTTETNSSLLYKYNFSYSKSIWEKCIKYQIPFIYASSAATYGNGQDGFVDDHKIIHSLMPLNLYAKSKNDFDKYILTQDKKPPFWCGVKFFNVFGFDESKKGKMSSIVYQAFHQIHKTNKMLLFKSSNSKFKDGHQCRDFIYIKDVLDVIYFFYQTQNNSGIYNVGTGNPTSFLNIISYVFKSMKKNINIEYINIPLELKEKYQYYTSADISKLRQVGYNKSFTNIEIAVNDYIINYLI